MAAAPTFCFPELLRLPLEPVLLARPRESSEKAGEADCAVCLPLRAQGPPGQQGGGGYPGQRIPMPQVQQFFLEGMRPEMGHVGNLARTMAQPPQMQRTYTIRNDVNLKKNSLKLVPDEADGSSYHLEFAFDASTDCAIKIFYAALEQVAADGSVTFLPLKGAEGTHPTESRGKGLNQTFRTKATHPLNTTAYAAEELTYAAERGRYPIIVCLEAAGGGGAQQPKSAVQSQTTFATISSGAGGAKTVAPLKQKIQVGSTSYELQEIYGIEGSATTGAEAESAGGAAAGGGEENARECVICMTEPRDTTVLPCRHMCMCSECAKVLRMQSEKCPICRTPIEQLLQSKTPPSSERSRPCTCTAIDPRLTADAPRPCAAAVKISKQGTESGGGSASPNATLPPAGDATVGSSSAVAA